LLLLGSWGRALIDGILRSRYGSPCQTLGASDAAGA
jgi:hypothetical protein